MGLKVNKKSALAAALEIDEIITRMNESMATLDDVIRETIPDRIDTEWSNELRESWQKYYNVNINENIEEMRKNGSILRKAVEIALSFSTKIRGRFM
jgi:hypothetical protein